MNKIKNFENIEDQGIVAWNFNGQSIYKMFEGRAFALVLRDNSGVIVVYFTEGMGEDNAIIFNADGTERCHIENPFKNKGAICFEDVYYVDAELTLIIAFKLYQVACVINHQGQVERMYETR